MRETRKRRMSGYGCKDFCFVEIDDDAMRRSKLNETKNEPK